MKRIAAAAVLVIAAGLAVFGAGGVASAADNASVTVVHGIPKTPVNVFVNGKSTLVDFKPLSVAGPLQLPAGTYDLTVFPAADTAGTGTPVIKASATLTAGDPLTIRS